MYRYEYKFPVRHASVGDVRQQINLHPHGFREVYSPRWVHNVYFDTIQLNRLKDHLSGVALRHKFRFRWYNDDIKQVTLEIKTKNGRVGEKNSWQINIDHAGIWMNPETLSQIMADQAVPDKWIEELSCMKPVLYNNYLRYYYEDAARQWRMTLDEQLGFKKLRSIADRLTTDHFGLTYPLILEAKIPVEAHAGISGSLNHFPYRMGRFSKYVTGMLENQLN